MARPCLTARSSLLWVPRRNGLPFLRVLDDQTIVVPQDPKEHKNAPTGHPSEPSDTA